MVGRSCRLRNSAIRVRRLWTRARSSKCCYLRNAYVVVKKALRTAIKKAKNASWAELIATIDSDPWGLPYRLVMGKLRKSCPTLSETLDEGTLRKLLDSLFPVNSVSLDSIEISVVAEEEEIVVDPTEITRLVVKRPSRNAAPDPDGVKAIV